jgi:hypothetical protein
MKARWLGKFALAILIMAGVGTGAWYWLNYGPLPEVPASQYHVRGKFGPLQSWPLTPIHAVTLVDGRVMTYGADNKGQQGGEMMYDIWDPSKGMGPSSHLTLPNTVGTDIFCAAQVVLSRPDGKVLLAGGDRTVNGVRNWSSPDINYFNSQKNQLESFPVRMAHPRWYPTLLTLPKGDVMVAGGRVTKNTYTGDVEIYQKDGRWGLLTQAYSEEAFGPANWNYPRMWVAPQDKVFVLSITGAMFYMDMLQGGSVWRVDLPKDLAGESHSYLPSVMYQPGKILAVRNGGKNITVDLASGQPDVKQAKGYNLARINATMALMADGGVLLSGGSLRDNSAVWFTMSNRFTQLWSPITGEWTLGPIAQKMRLYHSIAMLMPDATVLTGGGGAPGPQDNLNAEVYYPPYLFKKDGSGQMADRPVIISAPTVMKWGQKLDLAIKAEGVSRVTLVRTGSVTHTMGFDQRFMDLGWSVGQAPGHLQVSAPVQPHEAPPGYYYLFVIDKAGVPSVAKMVWLEAA